MNNLLKIGDQIEVIQTGQNGTIKAFLGSGGQGEVYRVVIGDNDMALKWYFPDFATQTQWEILERAIQIGAPNDKFLWPLSLVKSNSSLSFGYIMALRPDRFKSPVDLMARRIDPPFRSLIKTCMYLSDSYLNLHSKGFCYRDINFGNVFFDPDEGEVLICDNDNVDVDNIEKGDIAGTLGFMAPEIVRGEARPNSDTDRFSLAVLMFYILFISHPLEGMLESSIKCLDLPAMEHLYGYQPVFIFDPHDKSNRPDPNHHQNALILWPLYPQSIRNLFTDVFTKGLHNPKERVMESEWRKAMATLLDSIFICGHCGAENFYDVEELRTNNGKPGLCWSCQHELVLPFRIMLEDKDIVMLNANTALYHHHLDPSRKYDYQQKMAEVSRHPTNPNLWGLKNMTQEKWVATNPANGTMTDIPPGKSVPLVSGVKVHFGKSEGLIRG